MGGGNNDVKSSPTAEAGQDFSTQFGRSDLPPLPVSATGEEKDRYWFKHVYQGDSMRQLTVRAVVMGGVLGMLMSASNVYTTLAIGWGFGVAITSCVLSFVIWNGLRALTGGALSRMSVLENNCMQSTAAAAGSSTGATIATMFGALLLLEPTPEGKTAADVLSTAVSPWWIVASFTFGTACLGVFLAVPMKRQMINHEGLRFPSGVAAAETLRSLYSESAESLKKAYALLIGLGIGLLLGVLNAGMGAVGFLDRFFTFMRDNLFRIDLPGEWHLPWNALCERHLWAGKAAGGHTGEFSLLLIAAGVITRMRVCLSMFAGSTLLYFVVGPMLVAKDIAAGAAGSTNGWTMVNGAAVYDRAQFVKGTVMNIELAGGGTVLALTRWSLWGGTALMVSASLAALALNWKTIVRAFSGLGQKKSADDPLARIEVPMKWMVIGLIPISILLVIVQYVAFDIAPWAGVIAIAMSFILSLVACRATGETDTTPIGAMGKVMQLLFAVIKPGAITPNLASAGVAANAASASADLLTDLKSGYLLGANPRKQFIAQFCGVFFGTLAVVPVWFLMIPNKAALEKFAAPATRQWAAVAEVLTQGLDKLPESARWAIVIGSLVGVGLVLLERFTPQKYKPYLPSAMGLGLSWVIPFGNAMFFLIGAILGWIWENVSRRHAELYAVALASGLIAGESLMKAILSMSATAIGLLDKMGAGATP
jgi:OPT family oligopeptide transporter